MRRTLFAACAALAGGLLALLAAGLVAAGCPKWDSGWEHTPVAALTVAPSSLLPGETVIADASESTDEDGPIRGYCFYFGEPGREVLVSLTPRVTFTYHLPGEYEAGVLVFDDRCPLTLTEITEVCEVSNSIDLLERGVPCLGSTVTFDVTVLELPDSGVFDSGGIADSGICISDDGGFEPNDTVEQATPIGFGTYTDLVICPADVDNYRLSLTPGEGFEARILHDFASGDLDAILIDPNGNIVVVAATEEDVEVVHWTAVDPGDHFLEIFGFGGQQNDYTLTIESL